jgi:hypothetical protein
MLPKLGPILPVARPTHAIKTALSAPKSKGVWKEHIVASRSARNGMVDAMRVPRPDLQHLSKLASA